MIKDAEKILEMAKEIIDLKLQLLKNNIGRGHCPFAIYPLKTHLNIDCNTTSCSDCKDIWAKEKRKEIAEEVMIHYGLQKSMGNKD